ncbi:hypothetical protein F4678DRAFT_348035 [Xylaria arbuscula]|nr:hypothetical protein F4678DRAFT_348035 [Xylaria arbuscula]
MRSTLAPFSCCLWSSCSQAMTRCSIVDRSDDPNRSHFEIAGIVMHFTYMVPMAFHVRQMGFVPSREHTLLFVRQSLVVHTLVCLSLVKIRSFLTLVFYPKNR